jgi:hypothetical protein
MYKEVPMVYDIQQQLAPTMPIYNDNNPQVFQARNLLEECTNFQECKHLCLRNRECILYFTPEVQQALQKISTRAIDQVVNDGTHYGMQRYVLQEDGVTHEFWVLKKYQATLLYDNFLSYGIAAPYLYNTYKYSTSYFVKRMAIAIAITILFSSALLCAIVLSSEMLSWIAAGICIFMAGFNFLFILKLIRKYRHNPVTKQCTVQHLLAHEHSIPHVMFATDDTSEVL